MAADLDEPEAYFLLQFTDNFPSFDKYRVVEEFLVLGQNLRNAILPIKVRARPLGFQEFYDATMLASALIENEIHSLHRRATKLNSCSQSAGSNSQMPGAQIASSQADSRDRKKNQDDRGQAVVSLVDEAETVGDDFATDSVGVKDTGGDDSSSERSDETTESTRSSSSDSSDNDDDDTNNEEVLSDPSEDDILESSQFSAKNKLSLLDDDLIENVGHFQASGNLPKVVENLAKGVKGMDSRIMALQATVESLRADISLLRNEPIFAGRKGSYALDDGKVIVTSADITAALAEGKFDGAVLLGCDTLLKLFKPDELLKKKPSGRVRGKTRRNNAQLDRLKLGELHNMLCHAFTLTDKQMVGVRKRLQSFLYRYRKVGGDLTKLQVGQKDIHDESEERNDEEMRTASTKKSPKKPVKGPSDKPKKAEKNRPDKHANKKASDKNLKKKAKKKFHTKKN